MIQEKILELTEYGLVTGLAAPEDKRFTINRLLELFQLDELEDAICDFTTAMQLGRKDGWIFASMAEVLAKADRKEEAIQYYEQALAQEYGEDWIPEEVAKLKKEEVAVS